MLVNRICVARRNCQAAYWHAGRAQPTARGLWKSPPERIPGVIAQATMERVARVGSRAPGFSPGCRALPLESSERSRRSAMASKSTTGELLRVLIDQIDRARSRIDDAFLGELEKRLKRES